MLEGSAPDLSPLIGTREIFTRDPVAVCIKVFPISRSTDA